MLKSISELSELAGIDRRTCAARLRDLPSQPGPKSARLYESASALRVIFGAAEGPRLDAQQCRAELDQARKRMTDLQYRKARAELLPTEDVVRMITGVLVSARNRLLGLPSRIAAQLTHLPAGAAAEADAITTSIVREVLTELATLRSYPEAVGAAEDSDARFNAEMEHAA